MSDRNLLAVCLVVGAALAAITVGTNTFVANVAQFKTVAEDAFASRSLLLTKFANFHEETLNAMRSLVLNRFATEDVESVSALEIRPTDEKTWVLAGDHARSEGSLSGKMPIPTADRLHETWSALAIDPIVVAMSGARSDVVWFYYQSADNFLYLAPDRGGRPFLFDPQIYEQDYWTRATFASDPGGRERGHVDEHSHRFEPIAACA